jgi:hypothetical protein
MYRFDAECSVPWQRGREQKAAEASIIWRRRSRTTPRVSSFCLIAESVRQCDFG